MGKNLNLKINHFAISKLNFLHNIKLKHFYLQVKCEHLTDDKISQCLYILHILVKDKCLRNLLTEIYLYHTSAHIFDDGRRIQCYSFSLATYFMNSQYKL